MGAPQRSRLMDGDTKPCPRCHGMLVLSRHYPVLMTGMAYQTGTERGDRIRYEPTWVCRNGGCPYREPLDDSA